MYHIWVNSTKYRNCIDRILEYNRDPSYMRDLLLYKLAIEAKKLVESSPVGIRELGRRLGTSPTQIYRLMDEENTRKSLVLLLRQRLETTQAPPQSAESPPRCALPPAGFSAPGVFPSPARR